MRVLSLLFALLIIGCVAPEPKPKDPYIEARDQTDRMLKEQQADDDRRKQDYVNKYAAFRCDPGAAPVMKRHDYDQRHVKTQPLSAALNLRLRLGKHVEIPGSHTYRTESEFVLSTAAGKQLAAGESMMCMCADGASDGDIEVFFNLSENSVLVQEETRGAGSSIRHIAFIPKPGADIQNGGKPSDWQVMHIDLPERYLGPGNEGDHIGRVFGLSSRKIYVEMDGVHYAFPVEEVVTTELGISNG